MATTIARPTRPSPNIARMPLRIGINGFGRMGRLALRAGWGRPDLQFVHLNETAGGADTAAHLLTFDSVHGRWPRRVEAGEDRVVIDGTALAFSAATRPGDVPWLSSGVDVVLECTGRFRTVEQLSPYFEAGVKTVIVAAPVKSGALNVVMGVNDHLYDPARHRLLTAASCTTNCLAPVVKVVHETVGIRHGVITTIHDVTNTQVVVDAPHKDLRRARAASQSLIPTSTGSATAIGLIYPELLGKLTGIAVRVPLLNASLTDCVFEVERPHRWRRSTAPSSSSPPARSPASLATKSGRWCRSTTKTIRGRRSSTPCRRWSSTAPASRCWPGTTTRSATSTG